MSKIKIIIVDDHEIFRSGLRAMLNLEGDVEVIGEASDGEIALDLIEQLKPDVVLMDINMPKLDGIEMAWRLRERGDDCSLVALTAFEDEYNVENISSSGVMGYVLKTSGYDDLIKAVRSAYKGERYVDPVVASKLLGFFSDHVKRESMIDRLSDRELEILYWLARGLSSEEVALKLNISEKTIKNNISRMLSKLEVSDRTQAVSIAWESGLVKKSPDKLR